MAKITKSEAKREAKNKHVSRKLLGYGDYRYGISHRLTVDVYWMQHPDPYLRLGKSSAAHLTRICSALEYENSLDINLIVQKWLGTNPKIDKPAQVLTLPA